MPMRGIEPEDLAEPGPWIQFGAPPTRVDILTAVDGLEFADAWSRRVARPFGRVTAPVLCLDDLITNKRSAGRPQDILDAENLERRRAEEAGGGRVSEEAPQPRRRRPAKRPWTSTRKARPRKG
jgi:hypothetical protein